MTVYIGNAVGDEHGKAKGGDPGNQNGIELRIQPWYLNKKGWIVLRPTDPEIAKKLAYNMRAACNNTNIGYDQGQRNTLYVAAKKVGFDCAKVNTPVECDCSSLVRVCCCYAGVMVKNFNTASEIETLIKTGKFTKLTDAKYTNEASYLRCGDILVTAIKGHTAIVLNDGAKAQDSPEPAPQPAIQKYVVVKGKMRVVNGKNIPDKRVKVRNGNGPSNSPIGTAYSEQKFPLVYQEDRSPNWYKIVFNGTYGWISSNSRYTEVIPCD